MKVETRAGLQKWYGLFDRKDWAHPEMGWGDEPDRAQWVDPKTGLTCLALRGGAGAWCGYVATPAAHPFHGEKEPDVGVHGGVTFTSKCAAAIPRSQWQAFKNFRQLLDSALTEEGVKASTVCHVADDTAGPVWWIGFDTCHLLHDNVPAKQLQTDFAGAQYDLGIYKPTYKTLKFVMNECTALAQQIAEAA